ncbi:MAG: hypothetical protein QNJ31_08075 [Candidatus Caenarcaniphilales bacterium]|nr:hypothetical protein [Candidatus Caenarcaniphilales bacterium]
MPLIVVVRTYLYLISLCIAQLILWFPAVSQENFAPKVLFIFPTEPLAISRLDRRQLEIENRQFIEKQGYFLEEISKDYNDPEKFAKMPKNLQRMYASVVNNFEKMDFANKMGFDLSSSILYELQQVFPDPLFVFTKSNRRGKSVFSQGLPKQTPLELLVTLTI